MHKDSQERIDAYLRGEMSRDERTAFEADLKTDAALWREYMETKAIVEAIADRKSKLDRMAQWDAEQQMRARQVHRRTLIRRWTVGVSAAACLAIGFWAVRPTLFTPSTSPGTESAMPDFGNGEIYRGGDSSFEVLDSIIMDKDYERALEYTDSLIRDYTEALKQYAGKDTLTEKEAYKEEQCQDRLTDLHRRRTSLLKKLKK